MGNSRLRKQEKGNPLTTKASLTSPTEINRIQHEIGATTGPRLVLPR